ncbi:MAG: hypothetical protein FJ137_09250 [Deltaproteobacteria bacterium]|nr:hypothetical protein [Deltaproteobacteria bacterium]
MATLPPAAAQPVSSSTVAVGATAPRSQTRRLVEAIVAANPGAGVRIVDTRTRLLHWSDRDGVRTFHVHKLFLDTDEAEQAALARYLATGCPRAGAVVDAVVRRQRFLLDFMAAPLATDAHVGRTHDLAVICADVNRAYFAGALSVGIMWARPPRGGRRRRRSITYGTYDWRERRIAIHPALDEPHVPALVVARVVHHELLHARHGEGEGIDGRRELHPPAFRAEEATFVGAAEADAWLAAHLDQMLGWRPSTRRGQGR